MTRLAGGVARRWGRLGITVRLMLLHAALLSVVIGVIVLQSDRVISQHLEAGLNKNLADDASEYVNAAATRPAGESIDSFTRSYLAVHGRGQKYLLLIGLPPAPGAAATPPVLANDHSAFLGRIPQVEALVDRPVRTAEFLTVSAAGSTFRLSVTPVTVAGVEMGTFVSATNLAALNPDRNDQLTVAILEALAALAAAELAAYFLLRRVLRTVNKVAAAAEHARTGDLAQRLDYRGPLDEVGRLAHTMDAMLGQLDESFSAQRRLLADVSHQLRTPITIARGHLEVLARCDETSSTDQHETFTVVLDELTHLSLMVERLLFLGQALEPDFLMEQSVDLPALVDELFDAARVMANREWTLGPVPRVEVRADAAKLRGAILNLVDNAVRATGEADRVTVDVRLGEELVIEVTDTGTGITPEDQQLIFDRFRRSASSSYSGSGLGLAIVKAVAEAHGGRVELDSRPGRGSRFGIVLPASRVLHRSTPMIPGPV